MNLDNLKTEDEARATFCPHWRAQAAKKTLKGTFKTLLEVPGAFNMMTTPDGEQAPVCHCIASECAMWLWGQFEGRGYCGLTRER